MKKQNVVIFALLMVLLLSSTVVNANSNYLNVRMNGEQISVREVPILKDGNIIKSNSPSFVYVDRTLVSARLVAESYGAKVDWDAESETATINQNGTEVKLTINNDVARINGKNIKLDKYSIPRLVSFGGSSAITMVPINFLSEALGYKTGWDQETRTVHLIEGKIEEITNESNPLSKPETEKVEIKEEIKKEESVVRNKVTGVSLIEEKGQKVLKVNGSKKVNRNVIKLKNPERLVIDLMDSELEGKDYIEYNHEAGVVGKVRVSQFTPDKNYPNEEKIVRVVLDINPGVIDPKIEIKEDGKNLLLIPEKSFWDNINYDTNTNTLKIRNKIVSAYEVKYLKDKRKMEIDIPIKNIELTEGKKTILDPFVSKIEIIKNKDNYKVIVKFRRPIKYDVRSGDMAENIVIAFTKDGNIKKSDRIIVIDPGHGGKDPGAVRAGVAEKDLTLSMSLKLEQRLKDLGYGVSMTRDTDKTLILKDRPNDANDIGADLFISMHINSSSGTGASGIEVFYTPKKENPLKGEQQTQLAKFIQQEIIKETGAKNRGAKTGNFLVIRNTEMPSVLVEAGFISNTAERNKMMNDSYQNKIVDGIVKGIERYFAIY